MFDKFWRFYKKLVKLPRGNFTLVKQVLDERNVLEKCDEILSIKLRDGLDKAEYIKGFLKIVSSLREDINDWKNLPELLKLTK